MEKKIFIIGLLLVAMMLQLQGQVPQKFSYQAVIRNADGTVMASQSVDIKISLRKTSLTGDIVYSETFSEIPTNAQGVISLSVGGGTVLSGVFATIPWGENIFIQVDEKKTTESTYQTIGATQILSVPYALYAGSVSQVVSQPDAAIDDPIFVVKNKDGKIVFAVYQTGVKIYVEDSPVKGAKGGFAVGGLSNQAKGAIARDILFVNPDSTRINFNENIAKGAKGGFAVGGLSNQSKSATNNDFFKVTKDSSYFSTTVFASANITSTGTISSGAGTASDPVQDIDGNVYQTVQIGTQVWMKENLRTTHYSYGKSIYPYDTAYNYTTNVDTIKNYGRLYSYFAVTDTSNVCPNGWHVPSPPDWDSLLVFVGGPYWKRDSIITGLRLMDKNYWGVPTKANDASGFSGRAAGQAMQSAQWFFSGIGTEANWWGKFGFTLKLDSGGGVVIGSGNPSNAFSVRCVKGIGVAAK